MTQDDIQDWADGALVGHAVTSDDPIKRELGRRLARLIYFRKQLLDEVKKLENDDDGEN